MTYTVSSGTLNSSIRRLRFSSDSDIVRLTNARIIIIIIIIIITIPSERLKTSSYFFLAVVDTSF